MDPSKKRELKNGYKEKAVVGGIYRIQCNGNHRAWLKSTRNLSGQQNKFEFSLSINSCPEPGMRAEWVQYGAQSFSFTILEQIQKKETQTDQEFSEDIQILLNMWMEGHKQETLL